MLRKESYRYHPTRIQCKDLVTMLLLLSVIAISRAELQLQTITIDKEQLLLQNQLTFSNGNTLTYLAPKAYSLNPSEEKNKHLINPDQYTNAFKPNPNKHLNQHRGTKNLNSEQSFTSYNPQIGAANQNQIYNYNLHGNQNQSPKLTNQFQYAPILQNFLPPLPTSNDFEGNYWNNYTTQHFGSNQAHQANTYLNHQYPKQQGFGRYVEVETGLNHQIRNNNINYYNNYYSNSNSNGNGTYFQGQNDNKNNKYSVHNGFTDHRNSKQINSNSNLYSTEQQNSVNVETSKFSKNRHPSPIPEYKVIKSESIPVTFKTQQDESYNTNFNSNNYNYKVPLPEITVQPSLNIPVHFMDDTRSHSKVELVPIQQSQSLQQQQQQSPEPVPVKNTVYSTVVTSSLLPPLTYQDHSTSVEYYPVQTNSYQQNQNYHQNNAQNQNPLATQPNYEHASFLHEYHNNNENAETNFKYPSLIIKKDKKDFDFTGLLTNEGRASTSVSYSLQNEVDQNNQISQNNYNLNQNQNLATFFTSSNPISHEFPAPIPAPKVNINGQGQVEIQSSLTPTFSESELKNTNFIPFQTNNIQPSFSPLIVAPPPTVYTINNNPLNPVASKLNFDFNLQGNQNTNKPYYLLQPSIQTHSQGQGSMAVMDPFKFNYPDLTTITNDIPTFATNANSDSTSSNSIVNNNYHPVPVPVPVAVAQETNTHTVSSQVSPFLNNPNLAPNPKLINQNQNYNNEIILQNQNASNFTITPSIQFEVVAPSQPKGTETIETTKNVPDSTGSGTEFSNGHGSGENNIPIIYGIKVPGLKKKPNPHWNFSHHFPGVEIIPASASHFELGGNNNLGTGSSGTGTGTGLGKRRRRQKPKKTSPVPVRGNVGVKNKDIIKIKGADKLKKLPPNSVWNIHKNRLSNIRSTMGYLRHTMHDAPLNKMQIMSRQFHRNARRFYQSIGLQSDRIRRMFARNTNPGAQKDHHRVNTKTKTNRVKRQRRRRF